MTMAECVTLAVRVARRIAGELGVPVYLYGAAGRRTLAAIRRGPARAPDFGPPEPHPTAGATAVGARGFLIAYNILLETADAAIARDIARAVRASSGGLPGVQAMGVLLASRGLAQVSMNLTDFERTPVEAVYQAVRAEAARCGVSLAGGEIVGLVPRQAVDPGAQWWRQVSGFHPGMILENRLENPR
jgi:glutamate formiminotransferase